MLSFNSEIFAIDTVGRATLFLSFTFPDSMLSNIYVYCIVFCSKGIWNTGHCIMINALRYERLWFIVEIFFLRLAFAV